jgi:hypothetical protein
MIIDQIGRGVGKLSHVSNWINAFSLFPVGVIDPFAEVILSLPLSHFVAAAVVAPIAIR